MADTPTKPDEAHQTDTPRRDNRFHYYSGGEVKEVEGTRVSPLLWGFWSVIIVVGLVFFLFGGGLGPNTGHGKGFQPVGGSQANLSALQGELNQHGSGVTYASVDLSQLPVPAGQTVDQAVKSGADIYQSYCIGCHGPNQDGNGVGAGALNPKPRNLRDAPFMQSMSYQRITTSLHKGVPGTAMPRWENLLTDKEIGDVIAYVFSLTSPPPGAPATPQADAEKNGAQSGGSKTFVNGIQNSPKPITPAINGNPAAQTNTAPPSLSGPTPDQASQMTQSGQAAGAGASKPLPPSMPDAGGSSVNPPFSPGASTPKSAAPTPGGSRTPASTATPNPTGSGTGTGM